MCASTDKCDTTKNSPRRANIVFASAAAFSEAYRIIPNNNQSRLAFIRWYLYERATSPDGPYAVKGNAVDLLEMALARIRPRYARDQAEAVIRAFRKRRRRSDRLRVRRETSGDAIYFIGTRLSSDGAPAPRATSPSRIQARKNVVESLKARYIGQSFDYDCFCMLHRYSLMGKTGFQWALPEAMFDYLRKRFGINTECFASPINVTLKHYYSAFGDVDCLFGSKGDFFAANITAGAYECNPPFTEELMELTSAAIEKAFDNSTGELLFVVVFPGWSDAVGYQALMRSKWLRLHQRFTGGSHVYRGEGDDIVATFDSAIFILSTTLIDDAEAIKRKLIGFFGPT